MTQGNGMVRRFRALALAALVGVLGAGCGSGDNLPREAISGTVTFEGKPLDKGDIQFFPAGPSETAIATGSQITDGKYAIPQADGLTPGVYKVLISSAGAAPTKGAAAKAETPGDMPGLGPLNAEELIPAKYNTQTELTVNVKAGGPNDFAFDLKK